MSATMVRPHRMVLHSSELFVEKINGFCSKISLECHIRRGRHNERHTKPYKSSCYGSFQAAIHFLILPREERLYTILQNGNFNSPTRKLIRRMDNLVNKRLQRVTVRMLLNGKRRKEEIKHAIVIPVKCLQCEFIFIFI